MHSLFSCLYYLLRSKQNRPDFLSCSLLMNLWNYVMYVIVNHGLQSHFDIFQNQQVFSSEIVDCFHTCNAGKVDGSKDNGG